MTITHRMSKSPEHRSWMAARSRCNNPNNNRYYLYGARGIRCDMTFEAFFADLGPKPTPKHTVDRKRTEGNYEKGNIRWATPSEQQRNKRVRLGDYSRWPRVKRGPKRPRILPRSESPVKGIRQRPPRGVVRPLEERLEIQRAKAANKKAGNRTSSSR